MQHLLKSTSGRLLRFRTSLREPGFPGPLGVFQAARTLLDAETLDNVSARRLDELCEWFNRHLSVPVLASEH
jgi:hypothetical protein